MKLRKVITYNRLAHAKTSFWMRSVFAFVAVLVMNFSSFAQQAQKQLSQPRMQIGDQVNVDLVVSIAANQQVKSWFSYDTTGSHTEIISASPIDTAMAGTEMVLKQRLTITSFDSGRWVLPIKNPIVQNGNTSEELKSDSLYLDVLPVDVSKMKDYNDIKDIEQVKYFDMTYIYLGLVALVVIVLIILLVRYLRKKKAAKKGVISKSSIDLQWALSELQKLQQQKKNAYSFAIQLDEIVRSYLDAVGNIASKWKTSDEVMVAVDKKWANSPHKTSFYQALRFNDAIKFAKFRPSEDTCNNVIEDVKSGLVELDKTWKEDAKK